MDEQFRNPFERWETPGGDAPQYAPQQTSPYAPQGQPQQDTSAYGAPGYNPYLVQYTSAPKKTGAIPPAVKKKSHKGMIIVIVAAVLLIGAGITFWQLGFFHSKDGIYVWDDYSVFGLYAEIEIDGDEAKITMNSNPASKTGDTAYTDTRTIDVDVEFDGDSVTFSKDDMYMVCEYDRKNGKIIAKDDNYVQSDIEFEKK